MPEARTIPLPHVPTADAARGGWAHVLVLGRGDPDADALLRAFPGATHVTFAAMGVPPCRRLQADEATERAADLVGSRMGERVLLLTTLDLTLPDIDSVVGFSNRRRGAAVVSIARLRASWGGPAAADVVLRRVRNVVAHESGHLRGLAHCRNDGCVMRSAGGVRDVDRRSDVPCATCADGIARRNSHARPIWPGLVGRLLSGANP